MVAWANGPVELLSHDPTKGVERFEKGKGHHPGRLSNLAYAEATFNGALRRFYFLSRYTGQRISDVVSLNPTDEDEGGFSLPLTKTGVKPWCPIFPRTRAEMAAWERRPGHVPPSGGGQEQGQAVQPESDVEGGSMPSARSTRTRRAVSARSEGQCRHPSQGRELQRPADSPTWSEGPSRWSSTTATTQTERPRAGGAERHSRANDAAIVKSWKSGKQE
jgi:integrase